MIRTIGHVSVITAVAASVGVGLFALAFGQAQEALQYEPALSVHGVPQEDVSAQAFYIYDLASQTEIFSRNANQELPVASVTKLLSSALFAELVPEDAVITITQADVANEGRSGRLVATQEYQSRELLFPALLESSNDAAAVMERTASTDLIAAMNTYAGNLSLAHTHFVDASGLGDGNISTAAELSALGVSLYTDYPHIFDVTTLKTYLSDINAWMNNNPFVHDAGYKGGKHGYTYAANRTAIAFFDETIATGQTRTVAYVLLGSEALAPDMAALRAFVQGSVRVE